MFPTPPESITRERLAVQVDRFYDAVRVDPQLGPVFASAVADWPAHKALLVRFWASVVLDEGSYRGSPMAAHRGVPAIRVEHFPLWLALWREVALQVFDADGADYLHALAARMGQNLARGVADAAGGRPLPLPMHARGRA